MTSSSLIIGDYGEPVVSRVVDRAEPDPWEADVVLRDGHTVRMRSIRPDDAALIERFHERQSPESIYFRFFSPRPRLSERDIQHFTTVDHHDREAFVALLDDELIAVARYERYEGTDTAEVAFFVDDRHHGRGLATLMLEYLAAAALDNGITTFRATTLPNNRKMLKVFAAAGYDVATHLDDGVVDVVFDLRPTGDVVAAVDRRERQAEAASVRRLLQPSSIAIVDAGAVEGANTVEFAGSGGVDPADLAGSVLTQLEAAGYTGHVVAVDDHHIDEMPEGTDLVIVAGHPSRIPAVLDACGERGAGTAVVLSSATDDDTTAMVEVARRRGLRLLGPGSSGVCNTDPQVRLHAMPAPSVPLPGSIGILSESGDVVLEIIEHANRVGLGVSTLVSTEEPADLNVADLLSWWAEDEPTRAVLLHLGSGALPGRFVRAARAASLIKPVAALHTAIRPASARRSFEERRDEAMIRQSGVVPVANLQQLFALGRLLADQPVPRGRGVALLGASRGAVELAASAAAAAGLDLVSVRADCGTTEGLADALAAVAADPSAASVISVDTTPGPLPPPGLAALLLDWSLAHPERTVVVTAIGGERPARLIDDGPAAVPVFTFPEHAANALGRLAAVGEWRSTARLRGGDDPGSFRLGDVASMAESWAGDGERRLDHAEQELLLSMIGVAVAERHSVSSVDEAVAAARQIGWPIALKSRLRDRRKRTALSGVALDIVDEDDLRNSWSRMEGAFGEDGMVPGVVQRFVEQGVDVAVRVRRSEGIGTIEVGLGGPAAAYDPWELGVLPLTLPDASQLVSASSVGRALTDPLDRVPVVALVRRLAALVDAVEEIHEIVADPVIVSGPNAWITDVQVSVGPATGELPVRRLD